MEKRPRPPTKITDFKGKALRIEVSREPKDEADVAATKAFLELYTQDDGFHCPRCGVVITNPEEAVYHLADEMNKALAHISKPAD
ncbi:unnamed protein product [marine sediment metagenome]|uniref:Uncharacterized protein n=1 Tax=marine sediment metagenome TaxID=412755 RepID=X1HHU8_9ZZZZ